MNASTVTGIVVVDKPAGMTSHDVVHAARRLFGTKRVGHTGTLDPDATGVLVLCLGVATRAAEYLSAARKSYVAEVVFGIETDTQDASGAQTAECDASGVTEADVQASLARFRGTISQIPPMVSALHHQGKRLYELAREGVTVERAARDVQIDRLELVGFEAGAHPVATVDVICSTGTYIRTLAADLGAALGVGGMMRSLRRVWVGDETRKFMLSEAFTLDALRGLAETGELHRAIVPLASALSGWPQARLSTELTRRIGMGQYVALSEIGAADRTNWSAIGNETPIALLNAAGDVCAIARLAEGRLQPVKVLTDLNVSPPRPLRERGPGGEG